MPDKDEDDKEVLQRVSKTMRSLEDKLANHELDESTLQLGDDILKDIDSLMKRSQQPPDSGEEGGESNPSGGSGQDDQQQQGAQGQKQQKQGPSQKQAGGQGQKQRQKQGGKQGSQKGRQQRGGKQQAGKQQARGQQPGGQQTGAQGQPSQNNTAKGNGQQPGAGGNQDKPREPNPNADLYKDIWGHLPEALRAEMNAYSNPQPFIPKYDDLVKKYYRNIAEQGRRKGD
jgi:Ca-activated chloride channel family protein